MLPPRRSLAAAPGRRPATLFPSMCECFVPHTSHWSDRKSPFPPSRLQSFSAWFSHFIFCFISRSSSSFLLFTSIFPYMETCGTRKFRLSSTDSVESSFAADSFFVLKKNEKTAARQLQRTAGQTDNKNHFPVRLAGSMSPFLHRFCIGFTISSLYGQIFITDTPYDRKHQRAASLFHHIFFFLCRHRLSAAGPPFIWGPFYMMPFLYGPFL